MRAALVATVLSVGLAGSEAGAAMVTQRWGVKGRVQHPNSLVYEVSPEGTLLRVDLSALPQQTKVYRARLFFFRPGRYGSAFEVVPVRRTPKGKGGKLQPAGNALQLAPPHYRWFDATEAVRGWLKAGTRVGLVLLRKAPRFDEKATYLEIAYEGQLKSPPPPVTGVQAFCRSGQVFITFREIQKIAGGKEQVTWGELGRWFAGINYEGPVPRDDASEVRYRIYQLNRPITAATIGQARLIGEVPGGSEYNTRLVPRGDFIKRRSKAVAQRLAVKPAEPLPPGTGLFVHTVRRSGKWYYAVVSAVNGVENTVRLSAANATGPVVQRPAPPQPVLQRELITKLRDGKSYHERWYSYWAVPPQAPRPLRYDLAVGFCPQSMTHPAPLTITRGHTWGPNPEMPRPAARKGVVMSISTDQPNGFWTGTNDARDTLKGIGQGTWRPFTHNRQEALIRWAVKTWDIDERQIIAAIGAWGMWELKRGDLYAYIHGWGMPEVTKGFQCWNWARGAWGPPEAYADRPAGENPYVLQDYTRWVLENPGKELPYFHIHTGWGAHFTEMGWPPFPRFVRAMIDTRRAFCMQSQAVAKAIDDGTIVIRRDRSLPAFGNCSLDDNIGEGDLRSGRPFGQINGYLLWDGQSIVDEPALWEATVWLYGGDAHGRRAAPLESCTVDLTPRRCQRFKPAPGQRLTWTNVSAANGRIVQSGEATADELGLVTIRGLVVTKARHRISIRRK